MKVLQGLVRGGDPGGGKGQGAVRMETAVKHLVLDISSRQRLRESCQRGPSGQLEILVSRSEMRIELERIDWGVISLRMLTRAGE